MKTFSKLFLVNLLLCCTVYAQENDSTEESPDFDSGAPRATDLDPERSEALRVGKQGAILLGIGGRTEGLTETTLAYQHYLDPNMQIVAGYTNLDTKINETAGETDDGETLIYVGVSTEVEGSALSVSFRKFYGNSFYVEGGLDYAMVEAKFVVDDDASSISGETDLGSYSRLSGMFQIGNQWQWESFTLGTSWVGILLPLAGTKEFTDVAEASKSNLNSIEKFMNGSDSTQISGLRFHLGWAF